MMWRSHSVNRLGRPPRPVAAWLGLLLCGWGVSHELRAAAPGSSVRFGPPTYRAGQPITLTNALAPLAEVYVHALTETVPADWGVTNVSHSGSFEAGTHTLRWLFFDNEVRRLTYTLLPPTNASGPMALSGTASFSGESAAVTGLAQLSPAAAPSGTVARDLPASCAPAATVLVALTVTPETGVEVQAVEEVVPEGWTVVSVSATGNTNNPGTVRWGPFLDAAARSLSYTLRAPAAAGTAVFSGHGAFDATTSTTTGGTNIRVLAAPSGEATRTLPTNFIPGTRFTVTIQVVPGSNTAVQAVGESVPADWAVTGISAGGSWSGEARQIRWGPFLDDATRNLSYQVTPTTNASAGVFSGLGQFDGADVAIGGSTQVSAAPRASGVVRRQLPEYYRAGQALGVSLAITPSGTVSVQTVEETYPVGWTLNPASLNGGVLAAAESKVRWFFFDGDAHSVTYSLTPAADAAGMATFGGQGTFEDVTVATTGRTTLPPEPNGRVTRSLPDFYVPGVGFTVSLAVAPEATVALSAVTEAVPLGWPVSHVSGGGTVDTTNGLVRWLASGGAPLTLSYELLPPVGATEPADFAGTVFFDGFGQTTGGGTNLPANLPPNVSAIPDQSTLEDLPLLIAFILEDAETPRSNLGITLTHTNFALLPSGSVTLDYAGSLSYLSVTPATEMSGEDHFTLAVSDGTSTRIRCFAFVVQAVNDPPVFTPVADQHLTRGNVLSLRLSASDEESPPAQLVFSLVQGPSGVAVSSNGLVTWTSSVTNDAGPYAITVRVTDSGTPPSSAAQTFIVTLDAGTPVLVAHTDTMLRSTAGQGKVAVTALLSNDVSSLGRSFHLLSVTPLSAQGAAVRLQGSWVTYAGAASVSGVDIFTYILEDSAGVRANGLVQVLASTPGGGLNILGLSISNGAARVSFVGIPGRVYQVQASGSLSHPDWTTLGSIRASGTNGRFDFVDMDANHTPQRYYRTIE